MKNKIRIGSAVFIVIAIMMAATLLGPALNNLNTEDDGYEVNSVTIENEFTEYLGKIRTGIAGIAEYTSEGYHVESAGRILGYDDSELPITFTYNPEDGFVKGSEEFMEMFDRIEQYDAVFDENGNMTDVVLIVDGEKLSLSEYFDPVNECIFPILIGAAWLAIAATAVITATVVVEWVYIDENGSEINYDVINGIIEFVGGILEVVEYGHIEIEKVIDDIYVTRVKGAVVAVTINDTNFKLEDKYINYRPQNEEFYFALLFNNHVSVFPIPINVEMARQIMNLPQSAKGTFSVYTYYQNHAFDIARLASKYGAMPVGPEIHGPIDQGYMYHYHTANHETYAHAFFTWVMW